MLQSSVFCNRSSVEELRSKISLDLSVCCVSCSFIFLSQSGLESVNFLLQLCNGGFFSLVLELEKPQCSFEVENVLRAWLQGIRNCLIDIFHLALCLSHPLLLLFELQVPRLDLNQAILI